MNDELNYYKKKIIVIKKKSNYKISVKNKMNHLYYYKNVNKVK